MPARFHRLADREVIIVPGFLACLTTAVAAVTRFVFGDANVFPIPIRPRRPEMRNLTTPKPEATTNQTDESCLKCVRLRKSCAGFEEEFELPVIQHILVGVSRGECASVPLRPARPLVVVLHPQPIDEPTLGCMLNHQSVIRGSAELKARILPR